MKKTVRVISVLGWFLAIAVLLYWFIRTREPEALASFLIAISGPPLIVSRLFFLRRNHPYERQSEKYPSVLKQPKRQSVAGSLVSGCLAPAIASLIFGSLLLFGIVLTLIRGFNSKMEFPIAYHSDYNLSLIQCSLLDSEAGVVECDLDYLYKMPGDHALLLSADDCAIYSSEGQWRTAVAVGKGKNPRKESLLERIPGGVRVALSIRFPAEDDIKKESKLSIVRIATYSHEEIVSEFHEIRLERPWLSPANSRRLKMLLGIDRDGETHMNRLRARL